MLLPALPLEPLLPEQHQPPSFYIPKSMRAHTRPQLVR